MVSESTEALDEAKILVFLMTQTCEVMRFPPPGLSCLAGGLEKSDGRVEGRLEMAGRCDISILCSVH